MLDVGEEYVYVGGISISVSVRLFVCVLIQSVNIDTLCGILSYSSVRGRVSSEATRVSHFTFSYPQAAPHACSDLCQGLRSMQYPQ